MLDDAQAPNFGLSLEILRRFYRLLPERKMFLGELRFRSPGDSFSGLCLTLKCIRIEFGFQEKRSACFSLSRSPYEDRPWVRRLLFAIHTNSIWIWFDFSRFYKYRAPDKSHTPIDLFSERSSSTAVCAPRHR